MDLVELGVGVCISGAVTYVFAGLSERSATTPRFKALVAAALAAATFAAGWAIDIVGRMASKPTLVVKTEHLKDGEIRLRFSAAGGTIYGVSVDYPIVGHLLKYEQLSIPSEALTDAWVDGAQTAFDLTNHLIMRVESMAEGTTAEYRIVVEQAQAAGQVQVGASDRYKIGYRWSYKGDQSYEERFQSVATDAVVPPAFGRVSHVRMILGPGELPKIEKPRRRVSE